MDLLLYILFVFSLIFILINLFFYGALNRLFRFSEIKKTDLKISVVVAAKNEEKNILHLIDSLDKQSYPKELFEVIIVDDNSTDNTFKIVSSLELENKGLKLLNATDKKYLGKKGALDIGIESSTNPYILITDADCQPDKNWIAAFAEKFSEGNDFVFGIAPYRKSKSFTNLITRFENLRAHILMFSFAKLGFPYSAAARSFGFSREAFLKISGYKNTTETIGGDDDLLLREAVKNKFSIGLVPDSSAFVFTDSKNDYKSYVKQKSRHTSTSLHYSFSIKFLLAIWHLLNISLLFSGFLIPFDSLFIFPFFIKLVIDLFMVNNFQNDFGYRINLFWVLVLQIIYEFNLIYFFISGVNFKTKWE